MQGSSTFNTNDLTIFPTFRTLAAHEPFLNRSLMTVGNCINNMPTVFARVLSCLSAREKPIECIQTSVQTDEYHHKNDKIGTKKAAGITICL